MLLDVRASSQRRAPNSFAHLQPEDFEPFGAYRLIWQAEISPARDRGSTPDRVRQILRPSGSGGTLCGGRRSVALNGS
jgi:hypothetical protein